MSKPRILTKMELLCVVKCTFFTFERALKCAVL